MLPGEAAVTGTREARVPTAGPGSTGENPRAWSRPSTHLFTPRSLAIAALTGGLGAFLLTRLGAWPPNEDETLVFFVSRQPVGELLHTVAGERGGAPLHFLLSHLVLLGWTSLTALRVLSALFVAASVPVVAALATRLAGRRAALLTVLLMALTWTTLYHGIYARMYGLFLFASALSFLLLLRALEGRSGLRWALWGLVALALLATQPYGALVLAVQGAYVLYLRARRPRSLLLPGVAFAAVGLVAIPLWLTYLHLASRFDIGAGTGGASTLGSPLDVLAYLWTTLGDFTAGWTAATVPLGLVALVGLAVLARTRRDSAVLAGAVIVIPAAALFLTRSGTGLFLESRHLIFAAPFVAMALAVGLLAVARVAGTRGPVVLAVAVAAVLSLELAWGFAKTPWLFVGEPEARAEARAEAADWLAATGRADDVLFGYEPTYLDALAAGAPFGETFVPRADPTLALRTLRDTPAPLGRGVWVLDASDELVPTRVRLEIPERSPGPGFEARAFGPFLILRTRGRTRTPERFLEATRAVQLLSRRLSIGDAFVNLGTAEAALRLAGR